jgi:hypothetical protein
MASIDCTDPDCEEHGAPCPDCGREPPGPFYGREASVVVCDACGWRSECGADPPFSMRLGEKGHFDACSMTCVRRLLAEVVT